jgi:hypothetical protein
MSIGAVRKKWRPGVAGGHRMDMPLFCRISSGEGFFAEISQNA